MGLWMLAFHVAFLEDLRLCSPKCHANAVAFISHTCATSPACDWQAHVQELHGNLKCSIGIATDYWLPFLPPWPGHNLQPLEPRTSSPV